MNLFEFEGKQILSRAGIPIPESRLLKVPGEDPGISYPFVLKAQTLTGGRGKAGGIQVCRNPQEYAQQARQILNMTINGQPVYALLAEQMIKPERELYLSITLQGVDTPTLIASASGGMEIEQVAQERPQEILRIPIDPLVGVQPYHLSYLAECLKLGECSGLDALVKALEKVFFEQSALLAEINPLGVADGKLLAMDAKVILDDHAEFRMTDTFFALRSGREAIGYREPQGDLTTITFVPLHGEVGLISDGAGTGMLTLDLVHDLGGSVASFCELGGTTNADVMFRALEYTMGQENPPKSLLIVLIGGFNRMDDMANGIVRYIREQRLNVPIFTRMCGTMEEAGFSILSKAGLSASKDLMATTAMAVAAGKEVG